MATSPLFGWEEPDDTDLVKDGAAAIRTLANAIDTSMGDLLGGTTGQVLKKNSNTNMDFVWSADAAGMTNPMTTTGDTIYSSSGSTPARLGIGSTGQVLTVAAGAPSWATPASGGMTSLASGSLSGTSVSITSISGSYNNLQLNLSDFYNNAGDFYLQIQFNTDTGSNYIATGVNNANNPWTQSAGAELNLNYNSTKGTSDNNNVAMLQLFNYANTTSNKAGIATMSGRNAANTAMTVTGQYFFYQPATPAAITSIQIKLSTGSFSGGTYELFGVK